MLNGCRGVVPVWSRKRNRGANAHGSGLLGLVGVVLDRAKASRFRSNQAARPSCPGR
jgi:hypothetical protein